MKKGVLLSTGLVAAAAASLCCIAPLLAVVAGVSGGASTFAWLDPYRPYFLVVSVLALGFAFYQSYRPAKVDDCGCEVPRKKSWLNSREFLWGVTFVSALLFTFPYYAGTLTSGAMRQPSTQSPTEVALVLSIKGMTCTGCEWTVKSALFDLEGTSQARAEYSNGIAVVVFDSALVSGQEIIDHLETTTDYSVESSEYSDH